MTVILSDAVQSIVRKMPEFQNCLRVEKATVITAPDNGVCSVKLVGSDTVLSLPYSSEVADARPNDVVWVAVIHNSFRNAIVWKPSSF